MKKIFLLMSLVFSFVNLANASNIHIKTGALNGKIISESIDLTDWQASINCQFHLAGNFRRSIRYPFTFLKSLDQNTYSVQIKAQSLWEALPKLEPINCAYKLILIGKNKSTHQTTFGEIILFGTEHGQMSEQEFEQIQNKEFLTKLLTFKLNDLVITVGAEGGIIAKSNAED